MVRSALLCLAALVLWSGQPAATTRLGVCITNCVQCKQMFGENFHGQACADTCVATAGRAFPDCNDPNTISIYFKRLF